MNFRTPQYPRYLLKLGKTMIKDALYGLLSNGLVITLLPLAFLFLLAKIIERLQR